MDPDSSIIVEDRDRQSHAWLRPTVAWSSALLAYLLTLAVADDRVATIANNVAWTLAALAACISAGLTARAPDLLPLQRRGWALIATASGVWLIGQLIWSYKALFTADPSYTLPNRIVFALAAALLVRAVGWLSDSTERTRFTVLHLGNLGLIGCCLAVTLLVAFMEPAMEDRSSRWAIALALTHSTLIAAIFFAALYALWTQRWLASWGPMLLIVCGTAVYALGNFIYLHARITLTYRPADWVNLTWVVAFLAFGLAAHWRRTPALTRTGGYDTRTIARRTRQLEATIPALLIILMVVVGISVADQISQRVLVGVAALLLVFAFVLGAREAWIQREAQRLTRELRATNALLRSANRELQESEARVRDLNAHLEERVADRTRALRGAYEELEGFAYAVAHDLKAPLRAIDGFGNLLDEALRANADDRSTEYLHRIRRSARKMAALIEDLLDYSRIERRALTPTEVDLDALVADVVADCAHEACDVELSVDVAPIRLCVDAEALTLALRNLLQNALKFTRGIHPRRIWIVAHATEGGVRIVVRDNGIGFDMQYHEQIFKLFHRLHRDGEYQGTGIGLALVRKALERLGGHVRAESALGEGATFIIELSAPVQSGVEVRPSCPAPHEA